DGKTTDQVGFDPDAHVAVMRALYDAEVAYMDRHLKLVLELLETKGLTQHTVFSFNADHGEEFLEHGAFSHGQSTYAELIHVPWILRAPGLLPTGKLIDDNVANIDVGPTLLGLCGFTPPEEFMGRNLAQPLTAGEELPPTRIVAEQWG